MSQQTRIHKRPKGGFRAGVALGPVFLLLTLASGCSTVGSTGTGIQTGSIGAAGDASNDGGPGDPLAGYARKAAKIAIDKGQIHGATAHLTRVFRADPSDKEVGYELTRHLRYLGAAAEAEQIATEALSHHPDDPQLRLELGKTRISAGRVRSALEVLEPLGAERPKDPAVHQALGVAYDRIGRHEEAKAAYQTAMEAGKPSAALMNNYGLSHLLSGDLDKAIEIFRKASVAPGASPQVRQNLAMALALAGRGDEARQVAAGAGSKASAEKMVAYFERMAASGASPRDAWAAASGQ